MTVSAHSSSQAKRFSITCGVATNMRDRRQMSLIRRGIHTLLVGACFAGFWCGAVALAWLYAPAIRLIERGEPARRRHVQRLLRRCFRFFHATMGALGLVELRTSNALARLPPKPRILVANHPTLVDVTAILSALDDVCCIVKPSLMRSPFIGRLLHVAGHIDGGGGEPTSGAAAFAAAASRLREGSSVLIFPEGTRSPLRQLHAFKRGAFELAARHDVELLPLVLRCDPPALGKGVPFWAQPIDTAVLTLDADEPIGAGSWAGRTRALCADVEASYRARLGISSKTAP